MLESYYLYLIIVHMSINMNYQYLFDILEKKKKNDRIFHIINNQNQIKELHFHETLEPKLIEFVLREPNSLGKLPDLIKIQQEHNNFILSVGTILTIEDIDYCMSLGVKIFFSPHFDSQLFHYCCLKKCILIPGVYTPTEVMEAYRNGARVLKFFPSNSESSLTILQQFNHLFSRLEHIQFIASGGIDDSNYERILSFENVAAIGSSRLK